MRDQESQADAESAQQKRLEHDEADEPAASGAECGAQGDLALAPQTAHQEEIRDIQTGDQE
jgi:hypothetical protein